MAVIGTATLNVVPKISGLSQAVKREMAIVSMSPATGVGAGEAIACFGLGLPLLLLLRKTGLFGFMKKG